MGYHGGMTTSKKLILVGGLALVAGVLITTALHTKTSRVSIVSPEDLAGVAGGAQGSTLSSLEKKSSPSSPSRAVAPQTKQFTAPASETLILDVTGEFARQYQVELTPFLNLPPDFNTHYVVARWSCGNGCTMTGIIDKNNGKAYLAPSDVYGSRVPGPYVPYTLGSNLYRVVNNDVIDVYRFEGGRFMLESIEQL